MIWTGRQTEGSGNAGDAGNEEGSGDGDLLSCLLNWNTRNAAVLFSEGEK